MQGLGPRVLSRLLVGAMARVFFSIPVAVSRGQTLEFYPGQGGVGWLGFRASGIVEIAR